MDTSPISQHMDTSTGGDIPIPSSLSISTSQHLPPADHAPPSSSHTTAPPDPFLSTPWLRATQHIEDVSLLPTPPSLHSVGGPSEIPPPQGHMGGPVGSGIPHPTSASGKAHNGTGMLAELSPSYHHVAQYHPTAYQDPSLGMGGFVDMDGYGAQRRQRIAPDLDALFDELASLDGAEK